MRCATRSIRARSGRSPSRLSPSANARDRAHREAAAADTLAEADGSRRTRVARQGVSVGADGRRNVPECGVDRTAAASLYRGRHRMDAPAGHTAEAERREALCDARALTRARRAADWS